MCSWHLWLLGERGGGGGAVGGGIARECAVGDGVGSRLLLARASGTGGGEGGGREDRWQGKRKRQPGITAAASVAQALRRDGLT